MGFPGSACRPSDIVSRTANEAGRSYLRPVFSCEVGSAIEEDVTTVAKGGKGAADSLTAARRNAETIAKSSGKAAPPAPLFDAGTGKSLQELQANVMTEAQVNRLPGPRRGIAYIKEKLRGNKAAQEHQRATKGHVDAPEEGWAHVPVLRYENPNPKGRHFIKLDAANDSIDGTNHVLVDAKTKLALFSRGSRATTGKTLERVRRALEQNPGYKLVYELATEEDAEVARQFLRAANLLQRITVIARKKP